MTEKLPSNRNKYHSEYYHLNIAKQREYNKIYQRNYRKLQREKKQNENN